MPRSRCQLRVRDPQPLLLRPLLARPHRHPPILQTKPVDTSTLSAHESELAPRAAKLRRFIFPLGSCVSSNSSTRMHFSFFSEAGGVGLKDLRLMMLYSEN